MKRGILFLLLFPVYCVSAYAGERLSDYESLKMFYGEEELVVSPTRYLKSIVKTAENVTVVTQKEIELMNAHNVKDVLNTVTGFHMDMRGSSPAAVIQGIQGSTGRHVLVVVDGVPINNLASNAANLAAFPVQNIKRIEIIKGPASSAWGSSMGGVVNIITKDTGVFEDSSDVTVYSTAGESKSFDERLEVASKMGKFSSYFSGGSFSSDGLKPLDSHAISNFYGKLKYVPTKELTLQLSAGLSRGSVRNGEDNSLDRFYLSKTETFIGSFLADYELSENSGLSLSLNSMQDDVDQPSTKMSTGVVSPSRAHELSKGAGLKYSWQDRTNSVVLGGDIDDRTSMGTIYAEGKHKRRSWDIFLNDTISLGDFTVSPGIRHDSFSTNGGFTSPSLGVAYSVNEQSIVRAYVAKGFNVPPLTYLYSTGVFHDPNSNLKVEKVLSYQLGFESTMLKYVWTKVSLFRHDVSDALASESLGGSRFRYVNQNKQRKQGVEVEMKTVPWHDLSLFGGYVFTDATDMGTRIAISGTAKHAADVGLEYNDFDKWKGKLSGHYIWFDLRPSATRGRYNCMIWDLNLVRELYETDNEVVEGFVTGRNLLDDKQSYWSVFPNPGRNVEIGFRLQF